MEDAGQLPYSRASVREYGFDKKMRAIPPDAGHLTSLATIRNLNSLSRNILCQNIIFHAGFQLV